MANLCICIAGQLRGNINEPLKSLRALINAHQDHQFTLVFSVWDKAGGKLDGLITRGNINRTFDPTCAAVFPKDWEGINKFQTVMPTLYEARTAAWFGYGEAALRQTLLEHFPDAVIDIESGDSLDLAFELPKTDHNSLRMLYKMWRCNQIKRRIERKRGHRFDAVLRMRPDLVIHFIDLQALLRAAETGLVLVNGSKPDQDYVDDLMAGGSSDSIDRYCALFGRAVADPDGWDMIHHELHHHLTRLSLSYSHLPAKGFMNSTSLVTSAELLEHIQHMRASLSAEPAHEAVYAALIAIDLSSQGDGDQALQILRESACYGSLVEQRPVADAWWSGAARALANRNDHADAALSLWVTLYLRGQDESNRDAVEMEILVSGLIASGTAADGAAAASSLLDMLRHPWLMVMAQPELESILVPQIDRARRNELLCRLTINRLIANNQIPLLVQYEWLFHFDGVEYAPDVLSLYTQILMVLGRWQDALTSARQVLAATLPTDTVGIAQCHQRLTECLRHLGRTEEATAHEARASTAP